MRFQLCIIQLFLIPRFIQSTQVGSISNVTLSSLTATVVSMNASCSKCICMMILANDILGVSCTENQNCSLFYDYSSTLTISYSPNSSFHFLSLPPEQVYSTENSLRNTTMSKCGTYDQTPTKNTTSVSSMMNSSTIDNIRKSGEYLSDDKSPHSSDC